MAQHQLGLLDNALDNLNEALRQFESASETDLRPYKFAILHFAHFLELFFKHHVAQAHPLLVYKNPFSKRIDKEQTIGLWEAVQFLKNEGKEVDHEFWRDLEWLKGTRNDIEHHKFSMDTREVRRTLGRLIRATNTFNEQFTILDLHLISLQTADASLVRSPTSTRLKLPPRGLMPRKSPPMVKCTNAHYAARMTSQS